MLPMSYLIRLEPGFSCFPYLSRYTELRSQACKLLNLFDIS